jgi:hypothetical protein
MANFRNAPVYVQALQLTKSIWIDDWRDEVARAAAQDGQCQKCLDRIEGKKGDWLVTFPDGHMEIIKDKDFRKAFVPSDFIEDHAKSLRESLERFKRDPIKPMPPPQPLYPYQPQQPYFPMGPTCAVGGAFPDAMSWHVPG